MALVTIGATRIDRVVADWAAKRACPEIQKTLQMMTLAADEHVLLAGIAGLWLASRGANADLRGKADYLAVNVVASAVLPHIIKRLVDQRRPDRCIHGPRNGIGKSGNANDAFPSGHALHVGAIAAAVSRQLPRASRTAWITGFLLGGSRVLLLAHWASDVLAGLALGAGLEHIIHQLWNSAPQGGASGEHAQVSGEKAARSPCLRGGFCIRR
jgi:membrane-associated phospholipid phosphatase